MKKSECLSRCLCLVTLQWQWVCGGHHTATEDIQGPGSETRGQGRSLTVFCVLQWRICVVDLNISPRSNI